MLSGILHSQSKTVTFAAVILAGSALLSSLLAFVRERLLASHFGAGDDLDAYLAAFGIPDFLYGILVMGGLAASFLPVFSDYVHKSKEEAWRFASNLLNGALLVLGVFSLFLFFLAPVLVHAIAPGFPKEKLELTVGLMRIMFLSPLFFALSSVFSSVLHYFNRFLAYALAPLAYNIGIIVGILFLSPVFGIWGVVMGVVLGASFHALVQLSAVLATGFRWKPILEFSHPGLREVFKLALPRVIGAAGVYFNPIVMNALSSTLFAGSLAILNFANRAQMFPVGLIGISFALAVFPSLTRAFSRHNTAEFAKTFSLIFRQVVFFTLPVALFLFFFSSPIIQVLFRVGKFTQEAADLTSLLLHIFALSIPFQALIPLLVRAFFSLQNTKIPTLVSLGGVAVNIALAVLLIKGTNLGIQSLPLAYALSSIGQCLCLLLFLQRRFVFSWMELLQGLKKPALSSVLFSIACVLLLSVFQKQGALLQLIFAGGGAAGVFLLSSFLLKSQELKEFFSAFKIQFSHNDNEKHP